MAQFDGELISKTAAKQLGRLLVIYGALGLIVGLVAAAFGEVVELVSSTLLVHTTGIDSNASTPPAEGVFSWPTGRRYWILVLPVAGGLASGWLCARFAPEAMGTGTGSVIDSYHRRGGDIRRRVPAVKSVASALTIGTGGSAGIEGPIGFVAAGLGAVLARLFRLRASERRLLVMAGFAAGIGAVFHAPMAASIFAAEVLYREFDIEHEVLLPAIIASTIAYAVYGAVRGWTPLWTLPPVEFASILELGPYLLLAIALAAAGGVFIQLHHLVVRHLGRQQRIPLWLRPAVGGVVVGGIGLFLPHATGIGYGIASWGMSASVGAGALLALALAKMCTSSFTAGSGGSGGLFAPSLVIGGALGAALALAINELVPGVSVDPAAFTVVGMGGFFAAVINAPLSTVIMVSELAGSYGLLVPSLWVSGIAWFLLRRWSLYSEQAGSRLEAPGHLADMMGAVLRRMPVRDALDAGKPPLVAVPPSMPLRKLVQVFARTRQSVFPIIEQPSGRLLGVVDGRQLRETLGRTDLDVPMTATDFGVPPIAVPLTGTLHDVVARMSESGHEEVLIVDPESRSQLRGSLSRREVVAAYHARMLDLAPRSESSEPLRDGSALVASDRRPVLAAALERGTVIHGVPARDIRGVLAEIFGRAPPPSPCAPDELCELIIARERLGSTFVGDGIALPHPNTRPLPGFSRPQVVIATLDRPLKWQLDDDGVGPVHAVDVVVIPLVSDADTHLKMLGQLASTLHDSAFVGLLRSRASKERLIKRALELDASRTGERAGMTGAHYPVPRA